MEDYDETYEVQKKNLRGVGWFGHSTHFNILHARDTAEELLLTGKFGEGDIRIVITFSEKK